MALAALYCIHYDRKVECMLVTWRE